jgi:hypothetical protein
MATDSAAAAMDVNNPDILDTGFLPMSRFSDVDPHGPWLAGLKVFASRRPPRAVVNP